MAGIFKDAIGNKSEDHELQPDQKVISSLHQFVSNPVCSEAAFRVVPHAYTRILESIL